MFVDYLANYLFAMKYVVVVVALFITISGVDDLLIDIVYWIRRIWRSLTIYRRHNRANQSNLLAAQEKPLAIMIPAWQETGVIGSMADNAARTLDYENYHIFVGTYPNDPDTQRDVDEVCANFPNVHKVVCARPGPTSKADCLNNVVDAIQQFERKANIKFEGFILHDAEDVVSPMELRLYNHLIDRKDLIQIPVYPFERRWYDLVGMHYIDEFTELHAKDVPVREALVGQVPSAGVGTCFSRRAINVLRIEGDGIAFDTQSLTEDYDIGFRLKKHGLTEIFVRFPAFNMSKKEWKKTSRIGQSYRESNTVCVREFFPNTIEAAIRQKSRWIIGIVFQGYLTHRWTGSFLLNYFLWRDRKGLMTNFFSFFANLIVLQLIFVWLYEVLWPDAYRFMSIFQDSTLLIALLWVNVFLMSNRLLQRMIFVTQYYGLFQGMLALPRMILGNFINFFANWRALKQVIAKGNPRRVAWDKTTHDFPSLGEVSRARRVIGQILLEQGSLSQTALEEALETRPAGMRLGTWLVHSERISPAALAAGLAEQAGVASEAVDSFGISQEVIDLLPASIALHYAVLPIRFANGHLTVASESALSPIARAALKRKTGYEVEYVIAHIGQVTVGLRHYYARHRGANPKQELDQAVQQGRLSEDRKQAAWEYYVARQVMLGEVLQALGRIDVAAFSVTLLQQSSHQVPLGEFLVSNGIMCQAALDKAIELQKKIQPNMADVVKQFNGTTNAA